MTDRPTIYLIDGHAQFFRAYHAIRTPMTSPVTGEPTNMTFGFMGMLFRLLKAEDPALVERPPTHLVVVYDASGDRGTFRSQIYPEYKANRDAPPEDLRPQVERCLELLHAANVTTIGVEEVEADDVIATIAERMKASHPDALIRIVSKDKDLKQLLEKGRVEQYDVPTATLIDEAALAEKPGVEPGQVIDMLALMGDTVDNVPGVPGIGEKTAASLISEFGTIEAILDEVEADKPKKDWVIKGKRRENILASKDQLALSRELVTLKRDVEFEFDLENTSVKKIELAKLPPELKKLGFNRLTDEAKGLSEAIGGVKRAKTKAPGGMGATLFDAPAEEREVEGDYRIVRTRAELDELVEALKSADAIALDTETTHIRAMRADLVGLSFSVEPGVAWYVPVLSPEPDTHLDRETVLGALGPIIEDETRPKIGHNLKYDLLVLRRAGITLGGLSTPGSCDTMVASYLIDASRSSHSLDALSMALLERTNISITELIGSKKGQQKRFDEVPLEQAGPYAAEDADVTLQLANIMRPQLEQMDLETLSRDIETPLVGVLAELEYNGILVDPDELTNQRERLETRIGELRQAILDEAEETVGRTFDPDSPKQLAGVLFNDPGASEPGLGLKPLKKGKTGPSTDAEVLDKLASDPDIETGIPRLILDYRQLAKLVNTYLTNLFDEIHPETKRIHASFNQTVAATGRLSSSDPNLQNIPIRTEIGREIRKAFVAPEGRVLISADYSQIELRLLAHLSQDPALIEAFHAGEDIHRAVAAQVNGLKPEEVTSEQRAGAKMVNFGIVYGVTPFGLARRLGVSNTEAGEIIDNYKKRFAGITTFLQECVEQATTNGYVETMLKRRRPIRDIDSRNPSRRSLAERMAINSVVQGSAADLIKIAMVDLHKRLALPQTGDESLAGTLMLLQIHDELVFEADHANAESARGLITTRMEAAMELDVPLKVDSAISENWFEGK